MKESTTSRCGSELLKLSAMGKCGGIKYQQVLRRIKQAGEQYSGLEGVSYVLRENLGSSHL